MTEHAKTGEGDTHTISHAWPKDSAGYLMTADVPIAHFNQTLGEIHAMLRTDAKRFETINYIYVVDHEKKLRGVFSIKELYKFPHETLVKDIAVTESTVAVRPHTHQERVVYIAVKHKIKAVPVVDKNDIFLGVVPSEKILSTLYSEAREDILYLAGISKSRSALDNIFDIPFFTALKHRLPWLFIGLVGGLLAARIIESFERTLEQNLILAAFIPLIVYMSDAVGTQIEAFAIRDFVIIHDLKFYQYFIKQFLIVSIIGIFSSAAIFFGSMLFGITAGTAGVLAVALFLAILSSLFTGLLIPYFFKHLHIDPANASGPIATIISDIISVVIYFSIAFLLL